MNKKKKLWVRAHEAHGWFVCLCKITLSKYRHIKNEASIKQRQEIRVNLGNFFNLNEGRVSLEFAQKKADTKHNCWQRIGKSIKAENVLQANKSCFFLLWKARREPSSRTTTSEHDDERKKKKMSIETSKTSTMHAEQEENIECVLGQQKTECNSHSKRCNNNNSNCDVIVASIVAVFVMMHHAAVDASPSKDAQPAVRINKCCEKFEIYVDSRCTSAREANACKFLFKNDFVLKINIRAIWKSDFREGWWLKQSKCLQVSSFLLHYCSWMVADIHRIRGEAERQSRRVSISHWDSGLRKNANVGRLPWSTGDNRFLLH